MAKVSLERIGKLERSYNNATQLYMVFRDNVAYTARITSNEFVIGSGDLRQNGLSIEFQLLLNLEWKFVHTIVSPYATLPSTLEGEPRWLEMEKLIPAIMSTECILNATLPTKTLKPQ